MNCIIFGNSESSRAKVWIKLNEAYDPGVVGVAENLDQTLKLLECGLFEMIAMAEYVEDDMVRIINLKHPQLRIIRFNEFVSIGMGAIFESTEKVA